MPSMARLVASSEMENNGATSYISLLEVILGSSRPAAPTRPGAQLTTGRGQPPSAFASGDLPSSCWCRLPTLG